MNKKLKKICFALFFVLILFIPFQALLAEILQYGLDFSMPQAFWLTHWFEPVILILSAAVWFLNPFPGNLKKSQRLAIFLVVLGIFSVFFLAPSYTRGIEGFRFALFPLLLFLLASRLPWTDREKGLLTNFYLAIAAAVGLWAIIERLFPPYYLQDLGLAGSSFGYGVHRVVSVIQSTGPLVGPNQLGSYILPAAAIVVYRLWQSRQNRAAIIFLAVIFLSAVMFSFSRSAMAGLFAVIIAIILFSVRSIRAKAAGIGVLLLLVLASVGVFMLNGQLVLDLFTHGGSQGQHIDATRHSLGIIKDRVSEPFLLIFGSGLSTAGPTAVKYGSGVIAESWYLELAVALGLVGLLAWLAMVYFLFTDLIKTRPGLGYGLAGVSVAALFLHSFSDNPALSLTLFILTGSMIGAVDEG